MLISIFLKPNSCPIHVPPSRLLALASNSSLSSSSQKLRILRCRSSPTWLGTICRNFSSPFWSFLPHDHVMILGPDWSEPVGAGFLETGQRWLGMKEMEQHLPYPGEDECRGPKCGVGRKAERGEECFGTTIPDSPLV